MLKEKSFNCFRQVSGDLVTGLKNSDCGEYLRQKKFPHDYRPKKQKKIQDGGISSCHLKKLTLKMALSAK